MKRLHLLWAALCLSFLLTGCGTQVPLSGKARDDYMKSIKPYLQYWDKPGMTSEGRSQDSASCGGGSSDHAPEFHPNKIKAAQRPGETENATYTRLFHDWERCMIKKGYRYTGKCSDNEISRAKPACGAP